MLSNRPYLLRAFYQWILDSGCTPILVLDANHPRCKIPQDYVEGGEIVFNISPTAVRDLKITNELIEFKASFSSIVHLISAPTAAVLAIYAEENSEGIFFDGEEDSSGQIMPFTEINSSTQPLNFELDTTQSPPPLTNKAKPFLKLVEKSGD